MNRCFLRRVFLTLFSSLFVGAPSWATIDPGNVMLFRPDGTVCPSPCTSGITTVTIDSVGFDSVNMIDVIELSISTALTAPDAPDMDAPTLRLDFDTEGRTAPIRFIEHITNTGTVLWEEWAQTAVPFHWDPVFFPLALIGPIITDPMSIEWTSQSASVSGTSQLGWLPEVLLYEDPTLGAFTIAADTIASAVFNFTVLLGENESATIQKDLLFHLMPTPGCSEFDTGCESGVDQVAVNFFPAAVPVPPAVLLLLSGLLVMPAIRRRRGPV